MPPASASMCESSTSGKRALCVSVTTSCQRTPERITLRFSMEQTRLPRTRASSKATAAMRSIS
jgi:hypothetical protein